MAVTEKNQASCFFFFANFFFAKRARGHLQSNKTTNLKAWLATARSGDSGKTRPPEAAREEEVRQQATNTASCYFTDLWRLNEQKKRGAPSKEFAERERTRSTLVVAYMASYDVSTSVLQCVEACCSVMQCVTA